MTSGPTPLDAPDDLLAEALRAADAAAAAAPAPDPASVAAHLAGPGDGDVLRRAAESPSVRAALADVVLAEREASAEAMSEALRARLHALAPTAPARPARGPERVDRPVLRFPALARVAAAVVAASALATAVVVVRRAHAGPALAVSGVDRLSTAGDVFSDGPRSLGVGEVVAPRAGERVALRLEGGGVVVLGEGDRARVREDGSAARLALEAGRATVAARGAPVSVLLPGGDTLRVESGAAHAFPVADAEAAGRGAGSGARFDVAVAAGARAAVVPASGDPFPLEGPLLARWTSAPPSGSPLAVLGTDEAALPRALARDLEAFGDPVPAPRARVVSARRFRILDARSPGRSRSADAVVLALEDSEDSGRAEDAEDAPARASDAHGGDDGWASVAWRPDETAERASEADVLLSVRAPTPPVGADASPVRLLVRASRAPSGEGDEVPAPAETTAIDVAAGGEADASARVRVRLPGGGSGDLVLSFRAEGSPLAVRFEGLSFPGPAPATIPPPEASSR